MWPAIHAYRKAVAMGDAPAILCPEDQSELVPVVSPTGPPNLRCLECRSVFKPGLDVWDQIEANIGEVVQTIKDRDIERY